MSLAIHVNTSPAVAAAVAAAEPASKPTPATAAAHSRVNQQESVTISAQAQQASEASGGNDSAGDSH